LSLKEILKSKKAINTDKKKRYTIYLSLFIIASIILSFLYLTVEMVLIVFLCSSIIVIIIKIISIVEEKEELRNNETK